MARAPVSKTGGWGFDSLHSCQGVLCFIFKEKKLMSKTGPIQFIQEVRNEVSKVTWPSRGETLTTSLIVFIFCLIAAIFFFLSDQIMSFGIKLILGLGN